MSIPASIPAQPFPAPQFAGQLKISVPFDHFPTAQKLVDQTTAIVEGVNEEYNYRKHSDGLVKTNLLVDYGADTEVGAILGQKLQNAGIQFDTVA